MVYLLSGLSKEIVNGTQFSRGTGEKFLIEILRN